MRSPMSLSTTVCKPASSIWVSRRLLAVSTRGAQRYDSVHFGHGDAVLFGPETRGLPQTVLDSLPKEQVLRIPMRAGNRSLNLSNAVAVVAYEGWRQLNFEEGEERLR